MRRPEMMLLQALLAVAGLGLAVGVVEFVRGARAAKAIRADREERERASAQLHAAAIRLLAEAARDRALAQRQDDLAAGRPPRPRVESTIGESASAVAALSSGAQDGVVEVRAEVRGEGAGPGSIIEARARVSADRVEVLSGAP